MEGITDNWDGVRDYASDKLSSNEYEWNDDNDD